MKQTFFLITALVLLSTSTLMAQDIPTPTPKGDAVEITADEAIEWLRDENMYRARGNAKATQNDVSISAEMLSAYYDPNNTRTITEIHGSGGIVIQSNDQKAVGNKGVYNVQTRIMKLTGGNLSVTTPQAAVTAKDSIEYNAKSRKAVARGNAQASDGTNTIKSAMMTAWLGSNAQGKTVLKKVTATGGIRIETPTDIILGDTGNYDAISETAAIEGNVRITRGTNQLNGARAIVNLKTGVSQLLASPDGSGERVRALFYPGDDATPLGTN